MNARLKNIQEMENLVKGVTLMEHTMQSFNDDLTQFLIEGKLILNELSWPSWKSIKNGFHTAMDVIQGACALVSLASYTSVIGAPIGFVASCIDAAIDVGYAVGNLGESAYHLAAGNKKKAWTNLKQAGGRAAWAAVGLIPIAGDSATMARVAGKTVQTIDATVGLAKMVDAVDAGKDISKIAKQYSIGADVVDMVRKGHITSDMVGTVYQIDKLGDLAKIGSSSDAFKFAANVADKGREITNASDIAMTGNKMTNFATNVIDKIGNNKWIGRLTGGASSKMAGHIMNYADNYKIANASFATLDSSGGVAKLADFSTGGAKIFDPATDLGKKMFGHGLWGGGAGTSKLQQKILGTTFGGGAGGSLMSKIKNFAFNPAEEGGKLLRSWLFPTGDLTRNLGKSSNLIRSTTDVVADASKYVWKGTETANLGLTMFEKIATNPALNYLGKFGKWNKLPRFAELWQDEKGITTYDDAGNVKDRKSRSLLNIGPKYKFLPGTSTVDMTSLGRKVDDDGKVLDPGMDLGSIWHGGTPQNWMPPEHPEGLKMSLDMSIDQKDATDFVKQLQADAETQQDNEQTQQSQQIKTVTSKEKADAEAELKKQQQRVKNIKFDF